MVGGRHLAPSLALCLASAAVADAGGYLQLGGVLAKLTGTIETRDDQGHAAALDLDRDVGFGQRLHFEGRAGTTIGLLRVGAAAAIFDDKASRGIGGFVFEGTPFDATAEVESRLRWVEGEVGLAPIPLPRARFELLAGVRFFDWDGSARGEAEILGHHAVAEQTLSRSGPVPHVGASIEIKPTPRLVLRGYGKGLFVGLGSTAGHELDLEGTLGFHLRPSLEIGGGVRYFQIFITADEGKGTIDYKYRGVTGYIRFGK